MARKRKNLKNLDYTSKEYWNKLLSEEGLTMNAGLSDKRLVYVGDSRGVEKIQEENSQRETGRTAPKPACP